jgi:hypothetical protein
MITDENNVRFYFRREKNSLQKLAKPSAMALL